MQVVADAFPAEHLVELQTRTMQLIECKKNEILWVAPLVSWILKETLTMPL
jgi:hypothetical protein